MHDNLRDHARQKEPVQAQGEPEASPVVPIFQHFQSVPIEVDFSIKILLVEGLKRNPSPPVILEAIRFLMEGKVVFDWAAGIRRLLVLPRRHAGGDTPEGRKDWDGSEDGKEKPGLEASTNLP